ncbi:GTP-binding protein [Candidatus Lokiarchaeum ossiferum]|uniref:GTP-binding protein n=1 Tax=Candidatus Lokiarchaeum ossiferum TaxID=2951803 RepID=UPI00352DD32E
MDLRKMSTHELFSSLISNIMQTIEEITAAAIVDHDGLIIASMLRDPAAEEDIIGTVTAVFDTFINRVKKDFGSTESFVSIMSVENKKFVFADAGENAILTLIADLKADDNQLKVYGEHVARKIKHILKGEEVDISIPAIVRVLAKMRGGKLPKGEYNSKIIVLGDPAVGKTSLIRRFVDNKFADSYISTIGVDISRKLVELNKECKINLAIWDIAGQMKHASAAPFTKRFYFGANQCFLVCDMTRKKTFENIDKWVEDAKSVMKKNINYFILGNKIDLPNIEVTEEEIKLKADELKCGYILTSAKTGDNVDDAFQYAGYKFCETL